MGPGRFDVPKIALEDPTLVNECEGVYWFGAACHFVYFSMRTRRSVPIFHEAAFSRTDNFSWLYEAGPGLYMLSFSSGAYFNFGLMDCLGPFRAV